MRHVFVESNFLFECFRLPSERRPTAPALRQRYESGELELYVPYVCFQEARNLIGKSLPHRRFEGLIEFHTYCAQQGQVAWNFQDLKNLLRVASAEISRTKNMYVEELNSFLKALGKSVLHGTDPVFDYMTSMELDHELSYNDSLILSSVLMKATELRASGETKLYFATTDSDLRPAKDKPRLKNIFDKIGLIAINEFAIPDIAGE